MTVSGLLHLHQYSVKTNLSKSFYTIVLYILVERYKKSELDISKLILFLPIKD